MCGDEQVNEDYSMVERSLKRALEGARGRERNRRFYCVPDIHHALIEFSPISTNTKQKAGRKQNREEK